jgi:hypothetical protein
MFLDERFQCVPTSCKVILLTAPERAVTMNGGHKMNSWYDIEDLQSIKINNIKDHYGMYS